MRYACQTHLDLSGYFSSERHLSTRLIIQPVEQVLQRASSQPFDLLVVSQHQFLFIMTVELHGGDSCAGHHHQLPHNQRNVLVTLMGRQRRDGVNRIKVFTGDASTFGRKLLF